MAEDVPPYLLPGFDANSLTVPRLRSILLEYDVSYPSAAKKPQLVEIFNEEIAPRAKKILSARARIKRSSRGIADVPSSQQGMGDESEEEVKPVVEATPRRAPRKSQAASVANTVERPTTTRKSNTADLVRSPSGRRRVIDEDAAPDTIATAKRTRKSVATPVTRKEQVKIEDVDDDAESPFTSDNPFQSGSSPVMEPVRTSGESRRRTAGPTTVEKRTKSPTTRRRTQGDGPISTVSRTFKVPIDADEAGEEFTPEEQEDLAREQRLIGRPAARPPARIRRTRRSGGAIKTAPWAILTVFLGAAAFLWRQEKLAVGYCGMENPSGSVAGLEIPEWAEPYRPQCEPCPQHAFCSYNMQTTCEPDFILKAHPLSLQGVVPLPPTCEPDGEKVRKVKAVADRAVEELRERNAKFECGELKDQDGKRLPGPDLAEDELKREMSAKKRRGMTQEEFEDLWQPALGEIRGREEISSGIDGHSHATLRSVSLARISFSCAVRRSIRLSLARHFWKLVGVILFIASGAYTRATITSGRETEAKAKQLASLALDRLATQAALNQQDSDRVPEPWISMGQLRDDVLRDEFSASRRQKLWEKVQKKVEQNSNIRPMVREGRAGEVSRVWEWIGAVGALEEAWSSGGRSSGGRLSGSRLSIGARNSPLRGSTPVKDEDMTERRKWDEGRPVY